MFVSFNDALHEPGCKVLSIVFLAVHSSGVMSEILPCLYSVIKLFACSRPAGDVRSVLLSQRGQHF